MRKVPHRYGRTNNAEFHQITQNLRGGDLMDTKYPVYCQLPADSKEAEFFDKLAERLKGKTAALVACIGAAMEADGEK